MSQTPMRRLTKEELSQAQKLFARSTGISDFYYQPYSSGGICLQGGERIYPYLFEYRMTFWLEKAELFTPPYPCNNPLFIYKKLREQPAPQSRNLRLVQKKVGHNFPQFKVSGPQNWTVNYSVKIYGSILLACDGYQISYYTLDLEYLGSCELPYQAIPAGSFLRAKLCKLPDGKVVCRIITVGEDNERASYKFLGFDLKSIAKSGSEHNYSWLLDFEAEEGHLVSLFGSEGLDGLKSAPETNATSEHEGAVDFGSNPEQVSMSLTSSPGDL